MVNVQTWLCVSRFDTTKSRVLRSPSFTCACTNNVVCKTNQHPTLSARDPRQGHWTSYCLRWGSSDLSGVAHEERERERERAREREMCCVLDVSQLVARTYCGCEYMGCCTCATTGICTIHNGFCIKCYYTLLCLLLMYVSNTTVKLHHFVWPPGKFGLLFK